VTSLPNIPGEARCKQLVHQLLTNQTKPHCTTCRIPLAWKRNRDYGWCGACRTKLRPKAATWFRGSKLKYRQLFVLLWCWQQRQSPRTACLVVGVSYTTVSRWYKRFRTLLPAADTEQLSGVVEVDESFFGKRRYGHQTLVVGAIERDTRRLRLQVVPDRAQDTLELFLTQTVARDSLLLADAHAGYHDLEFYGYAHERCNHSNGHFGPTNQIENMWGVVKRHLRKLYGCIPTRHLELTLREWMARQNQPSWFASPQDYLKATLCSGLVD
jgi:transposase-like protein